MQRILRTNCKSIPKEVNIECVVCVCHPNIVDLVCRKYSDPLSQVDFLLYQPETYGPKIQKSLTKIHHSQYLWGVPSFWDTPEIGLYLTSHIYQFSHLTPSDRPASTKAGFLRWSDRFQVCLQDTGKVVFCQVLQGWSGWVARPEKCSNGNLSKDSDSRDSPIVVFN